jgi:hypothetical protein
LKSINFLNFSPFCVNAKIGECMNGWCTFTLVGGWRILFCIALFYKCIFVLLSLSRVVSCSPIQLRRINSLLLVIVEIFFLHVMSWIHNYDGRVWVIVFRICSIKIGLQWDENVIFYCKGWYLKLIKLK